MGHAPASTELKPSLNVTNVCRWPGGPFCVAAAHAPHNPSVVDLRIAGHPIVLLGHDPGTSWPDKRGQQIMSAVLAECGTVILLFDNRHDAEACRRRLARSVS